MNAKPHWLFFLVIFSVNNAIAQTKASWVGSNLIGVPCTGAAQGYDPYDYLQRQSIPQNLDIVEGAHFTAEVENLVAGATGSIAGDLDYTLRAWPNHHRALLSVVRYQLKVNSKIATENKLATSPECYFQRAVNFSPKDAVTASLYGYYLRKTGHPKEAVPAYEKALELAPNASKIEYAYSLLLIDLKQYDKALVQAKNAYRHGKPPEGLKNKLLKLGIWK